MKSRLRIKVQSESEMIPVRPQTDSRSLCLGFEEGAGGPAIEKAIEKAIVFQLGMDCVLNLEY